MDEKNKNIRLVRNGGRRITDAATEYDWSGLERRMKKETASKQSSQGVSKIAGGSTSGAAALKKKVRHQQKQKQRRLKLKRRRAAIAAAAAAIAVCIILFMTPIFNIRQVTVEGNSFVSEEQFSEILKPLVGHNLFATGGGKIRKMLKEISYINTVNVQKKLFPPTVRVEVSEYSPAAFLRAEGKSIAVTSSLHVLSEDGSAPFDIPSVTGVEVSGYKLGGEAELSDEEKAATLEIILSTLEAAEIADKIIEIDINDLTDIKINYDNRITVKCGTQLEIERKLRLFKEAVTSNSLAEDARGTMDLSETGKAVYTP